MKALANEQDERLQIQAAQHDPSRFAELYENNFHRVYAFILRRVGDRDIAQDLTAETFHQALAKLHHFQDRGAPFISWLLRIAANAMADRWHHIGKREVPAELLTETLQGPACDDGIERRALLFQLVESLPADQQLVVHRRFVEQRSIREIAREMGRTEGAVKQLQYRALESLRARVRKTQ